jgi:hypothetical protein
MHKRTVCQTGTGRDILLQLREEHAEGSRTHYLAGPETHCGNWQKFWLVKNKVGPKGAKEARALQEVLAFALAAGAGLIGGPTGANGRSRGWQGGWVCQGGGREVFRQERLRQARKAKEINRFSISLLCALLQSLQSKSLVDLGCCE